MNIYDTWYEHQTDKILGVFKDTATEESAEQSVRRVDASRATIDDETRKVIHVTNRVIDGLRGAAICGCIIAIGTMDFTSLIVCASALVLSAVFAPLMR